MAERVEHVMGMPVRVAVRDPAFPRAAVDGVFAWLRRVDATFSTYERDSAISRIGRGELEPAQAGPLVREVLDRCERLRGDTGGYFDAGAAGRLDPSGLVKGWAVERAAARLEAAGVRSFCIDAAGDICVRGGPWRVGIRHPRRRDRLAAVLELGDGAVATSGAYERGDHIVDPHTRRPATGAQSVSVVGPDLGLADAYATAAFAMGADGAGWTAALAPYEAMVVVAGERVLCTRGFERHCAGGSIAASM